MEEHEMAATSREIIKDKLRQCFDGKIVRKDLTTAVAAAYAKRRHLKTCNIVYTPVEQTFLLMDQPGLLFHGTNDPWMPHDLFLSGRNENSPR